MKNFFVACVNNKVFANIAMMGVLIAGVFAATSMIRESNPTLTLPFISIVTPYPGADPEEVEEGITQKIAAAIDGLEGIKRYYTTSEEGQSFVQVEVTERDIVESVKDRVENAVNGVVSLPAEAERPRVTRQTETEEVTLVALWGELPERQLKHLAERVRQELRQLPEVSLVSVFSTRPYEIAIEVSEDELLQHGLSFDDVATAVRRTSMNVSAGDLRLKGEEIRLRALGRRYTGPEFESVVVKASPDGNVVTLADVARIDDGFAEEDIYASFNGLPCAMLEIQKAPGEDSITISRAVGSYIAQLSDELPEGVTATQCFDNTQFIDRQIAVLSMNGLIGLGLVLVILWLFLEPRLGFWVAMGIPTSLAGALVVLWLLGASINQVSVVAMIVVMGIIVDDAIVVGEAIYHHRRLGKSPVTAAVDGVQEVGLPVFASVTTTIVANLPLAFISGIFGQFVAQVPLVVVSALIVSLVECMVLLPAHLNHRKNKLDNSDKELNKTHPLHIQRRVANGLEWFVERAYQPVLLAAIRYRFVTLCAAGAVLLVTVGLVGGGLVRFMMWPGMDGITVRSHIEYPPGTPLDVVKAGVIETRKGFERVAERLQAEMDVPLVKNIYASAPYNVDTGGRVIVEMAGPGERTMHSDEILAAWRREVGHIPGTTLHSFEGDRIGAGGRDIEIWLRGNNLDRLKEAAGALKTELQKHEGVHGISDNFRSGKTEFQISLKSEAHSLGLTLADVSGHLRAGYYGDEALRIQRGREDMRVRVRYPEAHRATLSEFKELRIPIGNGRAVPFTSVATIDVKEGVSSIEGINGRRGVVVRADVDRTAAAPHEVIAEITDEFLASLPVNFPGVTWSLAGAEESNRETLGSLQNGFVIALLGIFLILATLFRSYLQPMIIMIIIPFGVIGAIFGHLLLGIPVTFLSLFGIVALAGVIVNSAIVLIECINTNLREGRSLEDAVCRAGLRRFRAIFLTSLSTCLGLTPLIMEDDFQAQIVIPMAVSLAAGVAFATVLTLLLTPALFVIVNDARRLFFRLAKGRWPTPEEVEPSAVIEEQPIVDAPTTQQA